MSPEIVVLKLNEMARKREKEMIDLVLLLEFQGTGNL